jgi:protein SCO1/2
LFHFRTAPGHVLFVYFGYTTCPDVCPTTLSDLRRALHEVGGEASRVDVAFVTVDPARDVARVLEPYLASFVRGGHPIRPRTRGELAPVQRAFGGSSTVTRAPDGTVEVTHSATSYLVDERGRIVDEWPFGTKPEAMAQRLRTLLAAGRAWRARRRTAAKLSA